MSFSIKNSNTPVKKYDPKTEQNILKKSLHCFNIFIRMKIIKVQKLHHKWPVEIKYF